MEFPDRVDPWKAADGQRTFHGTMPLSRMGRLAPLLESTDGEARFTASFDYDRQKQLTVELEVEAGLSLMCQRSLEPYTEQIRRRSVLAVIEDISEQDELPENYEAVLVQDGRLTLLQLVEDELLLGVPQVPRNPEAATFEFSTDGQWPAQSQDKDGPLQRPFAGLAGMMKENKRDR
jgi:uncharacterized protein